MDKSIVRTVKEVAAAFDVGRDAVLKWKRQGMPFQKVGEGRRCWYDLDKIFDWRVAREGAIEAKKARLDVDVVLAANMPKMGELKAAIEEFKVNRGDVLAAEQMQNLDLQARIRKTKLGDISDEDLEKWTQGEARAWFKVLGVDFAIKFDKERLERSESVDNVNKVLDMIGKIKELERG